jgi:hypothetical protein
LGNDAIPVTLRLASQGVATTNFDYGTRESTKAVKTLAEERSVKYLSLTGHTYQLAFGKGIVNG